MLSLYTTINKYHIFAQKYTKIFNRQKNIMDTKNIRLFFLSRMREMYHKDSLDSYRVRNHNTLTLLDELQKVIEGRLQNRVKRNETVKYCIEEFIDSLKEDNCIDFSFFDKNEFINKINNFKTDINNNENQIKEELSNDLLFYIRKCIKCNKSKYLLCLLNDIEEKLFVEKEINEDEYYVYLEKFDKTISSFATELIHIGYSKGFLYRYFNGLSLGEDVIRDRELFNSLKNEFLIHEKKDYIIVFRLQMTGQHNSYVKELFSDYPEFNEKVPDKLLQKANNNKSQLKPNPAVRFYINQISALDPISAVKECRIILSRIIDIRHNGSINTSIEIPHCAYTFECINNGNDYKAQFYNSLILDSTNGGIKADTQKFVESLERIDKDQTITQDVKDRIKFALRHLRIGDAQPEVEQRFINYWVGLEFIFSSPSSSESTFMRMKKHFTNIHFCSYAKRNMYWFNNWLVKSKVISSGQLFWEVTDIETKIKSYKNVLAFYRYKILKRSMLVHSDKRKSYLNKHQTNIERHLSRLYRLRNELIHEATTKEYIENSTSNLRYYLVFLINQIVYQFSKDNENRMISTINDFFMEYECSFNRIRLKWEFEVLMGVDFTDDLLS